MAGEIQLNGTSFASESGGTITVNNGTIGSSVVFPAGHVIQTKIIKDSTARGAFTIQGDQYTGVSIIFNNNLSSTNSIVIIDVSLQVDTQIDTGYGFTWATVSTTNNNILLSSDKIGVDGNTITNFSRGEGSYINADIHGDHISFITCDSSISSTTPKTYYLWLTNAHGTGIYMNSHTNLGQGRNLPTNGWPGSSTAVYRLTEIAE